MLALRAKFRELGIFTAETQPNFTELLDLVALGTIADVVPLEFKITVILAPSRVVCEFVRNVVDQELLALAEVANREVEKLLFS